MFVLDFRLSSIWTEGVRDAFVTPQGTGRMGGLMDPNAYARQFAGLLAGAPDPLLALPWPGGPKSLFPPKNAFWSKYVLRTLLDTKVDQRGPAAWNALAPFRRAQPLVRLRHDQRCFIEAWYHPHGVSVIATAWFRGRYRPGALGDAAHGFLHDQLAAEWPEGPRSGKLDTIAAELLTRLRDEAFGAADGGPSPDPIRILTLVRAEPEGDEAPDTAFAPFEQAAIAAIGGQPLPRDAADRNIQSLPRGLMVTRPDKALARSGRTHTLGCLHRNTTIASAQVASLLAGAKAALAAIAQLNNDVPPRLEPYLGQLATQLGCIYQGDVEETYDQACVQLQARRAKTLINRLRATIPLAPLP